jgi:Tetratricopeptide repeat.
MDRSAGERNEVRKFVSRFRRWLDDPESSPGIIRDLAGLDNDRLGEFVRLNPEEDLLSAITTLLRRAHETLSSAPREAVTLSRLATRLCSCHFSSDPQHDVAIEGDAWKEYAEALLSTGDYSEADAACLQAGLYYSLVARNRRLYERTLLTLVQAQVAFFSDDLDRALVLADTAAMTLEMAFPTKKRDYVRARTTFATALVRQQRYDEGLRALEECAELARRENDTETLASLVNNIGQVYARLGNLKAARDCFNTAIEGFTSLGMKTEMPRVHAGLARILMQEGRYNHAVSEHYQARAAYLDLKMPVVAAEVTLQIIEALFAAGRLNDIPPLCAEAIETFTKANLPREAAKALAYIDAAAQQRTLTADAVEDVRGFFQRLQADPDERFGVMDEESGA